jgi:predicted transcriptional regulator
MKKRGLHKGELLFSKDTRMWKILETLVSSQGPLNVTGIARAAQLDYAYCHKRLKILQHHKFVDEKKREKGPKGRDLSFYDLTVLGLVIYMAMSNFQDLDKVARKYRDLLPHIFGEWDYFNAKAVKQIVVNNLKWAVTARQHQLSIEGLENQIYLHSLREDIEEGTLTPWMVAVHLGFWNEKMWNVQLHQAIRENRRLWTHFKPHIAEAQKETEKLLNKLKELL